METWDLYDIHRIKLNKTMNKGEVCPKGCYRILVHIVIFNSKGEMLIQHKHPDKADDLWDISAAGSCISNETSQQAAMRETKEELDLDINLTGIRPNLTINVLECFNDIYIINNMDIINNNISNKEVSEVRWASIEEIKNLIDYHKFVPYHKSYIDLLFHLKDHIGVHKNT